MKASGLAWLRGIPPTCWRCTAGHTEAERMLSRDSIGTNIRKACAHAKERSCPTTRVPLFSSVWLEETLLHTVLSTWLCIPNPIVSFLVVGIGANPQSLRTSVLGPWLLSILHGTVLGDSTAGCARGSGSKGLAKVMVRGAPHMADGGRPRHAATQAPASPQGAQPDATTTHPRFTANQATADRATATKHPRWAAKPGYARARKHPLGHNHIVGIGELGVQTEAAHHARSWSDYPFCHDHV